MSSPLVTGNQRHEAATAWDVADAQDSLLRQVSVVVPLYNETQCLPHLMRELQQLIERNLERFGFEFVFVDDGSTDGTGEQLLQETTGLSNVRVIAHDRNRGIAAAIQTGIRAASHDTVASVDADGSYDLRLLDEMIPELRDDAEMVTASPYHPAGGVENVPAWRLWISKQASAIYRSVMLQKLHCCTSCFRVYRRSTVARLPLENEGFVGIAEMAWRIDRQGCRIVEYPAILRTRVAGHSKMKVARATLRHLQFITKTFSLRRTLGSSEQRVPSDSVVSKPTTRGAEYTEISNSL